MMFSIECFIALCCCVFLAFALLVLIFSSSSQSDRIEVLEERIKIKNKELEIMKEKMYKEKFFEELEKNKNVR